MAQVSDGGNVRLLVSDGQKSLGVAPFMKSRRRNNPNNMDGVGERVCNYPLQSGVRQEVFLQPTAKPKYNAQTPADGLVGDQSAASRFPSVLIRLEFNRILTVVNYCGRGNPAIACSVWANIVVLKSADSRADLVGNCQSHPANAITQSGLG